MTTTYPKQRIRVPAGINTEIYSTSTDLNGGELFEVEGNDDKVMLVLPAMSFKRMAIGGYLPAHANVTSKFVDIAVKGSIDGVHISGEVLASLYLQTATDPGVSDGTYITDTNGGEIWYPYYVFIANADGVASRAYVSLDIAVTNL